MKRDKNSNRLCGFTYPLLLAVLFFVAGFLLVPGGMEAGAAGKGKKGKTIYEKTGDWKLRSLDGKEVSFSDFKGKVVFLNFWATWCIPCFEEMPAIDRLRKTLKNEEIVFLLISNEKEKTVRKFVEKHKLDLPIYLCDKKMPKCFNTKRLPLTYFLDRNGKIAFRCTGTTAWDDPGYQEMLKGLAKP